MTISMRTLTVGTFVPTLRTLSELLDKGAAHAAAKGYDPQVLIDDRLAPDMLPLWFHVQFACHQASEFTAVLLGRPHQEFNRSSATGQEELKALVAATIARLEALPEAAFDGSADRDIVFPLQGNLQLEMKGLAFLQDWITPQVYFHVVIAYAILRHDGVPLGIQDYGNRIASSIRQSGQAA